MKIIIIFGNSAVGKMTVGQELTKITNLKLFHNHMMIEPVLDVFGKFDVDVINKLRRVVFEEFVKTDLEGLIFTYMWGLDREEDWDYIKSVTDLFTDSYYVELVTTLEERLKRNKTENRLKHKPSKRNIEESETRVKKYDQYYRLESYEGEIPFKNYLKIDNTNLEPNEVAEIIKKEFELK